jgi:hypothetical protein
VVQEPADAQDRREHLQQCLAVIVHRHLERRRRRSGGEGEGVVGEEEGAGETRNRLMKEKAE